MSEGHNAGKVRLFLVESPFQLISATEAAAVIRPDERAILLIMRRFTGHERNDDQIKRLLKRFEWSDVRHLELSNLNFTSYQRKLLRFIGEMQQELANQLSAVFIGEFRWDLMHYIAKDLDAEECWLLDDGTAILEVSKNPDLGWRPGEQSNVSRLAQKLLLRISGRSAVRSKAKQKRFIFTAFHSFFQDQRVVPNKLEYLGRLKSLKQGEQVHVIVGQKLSEVGACSREVEIAALSRIASDIIKSGHRPIYISHREDSAAKLKSIGDITGVEIKSLTLPIEVEYVFNQEDLASVSGFFSTALFTLQVIIPSLRVISYRLPESVINEKWRSSIANFYTALESTHATANTLNENELAIRAFRNSDHG